MKNIDVVIKNNIIKYRFTKCQKIAHDRFTDQTAITQGIKTQGIKSQGDTSQGDKAPDSLFTGLKMEGANMGIGSTKGIENMSGRPMGGTQPVDPVIKNIQDEISETQRQRQGLSSKEELSAAEKAKKRQELQQKISDLNRELRLRQAEARKEQQKDALADESRTDVSNAKNADEKAIKAKNITARNTAGKNTEANDTKTKTAGRTDVQDINGQSTGSSAGKVGDKASQDKDAQDKASQLQDIEIPQKEWKAVIESNSSREQARKQEAVIARIEGGIAILKSEIKLDEARGMDVEKKKEELKNKIDKLQKAASAQFPSPDQPIQAAKKTAPAKPGETTNFSKEKEPAEQQPLFKDITVSFTT